MQAVRNVSKIIILVWLMVHTTQTYGHDENLVFVIVDEEGHKSEEVQELAAQISSQTEQLHVPCVVHITSQDWSGTGGSWTYFPLLEWLNSEYGSNRSWVVLVGGQVQVTVSRLLQVLHTQDSSQLVFLGRGLVDKEETIIHHFSRVDPKYPFLYPDVRAGMVFSSSLINRLAKKWLHSKTHTFSDLNIDAPYEFATFVKSAGVELTPDPSFCVVAGDHCAILYTPPSSCGKAVEVNRIHFAVKSCKQYHTERLPVLYNTWLKQAINYAVYSDVEDSSYGTTSLGVPNTERGHCGKTLAIIRHAAQLEGMLWLVIADDDTLLSVGRMSELLACHDHTQPVALGERYGYAAAMPHGYNYITGGGGMVFSQPLVKMLATPGVCVCPSNSTPDDMFLGMCLLRLNVPITHSSAFHQARPGDYPAGILEGERPVSFHKFWMVDPYQVFVHWLHSPPAPNLTPTTTTHHQDEL